MTEPASKKPWLAALAVYKHPRVRGMLFLGFSAGLTFPLVLTTLSLRLRQSGIDRTTIGLFSLVGLMYSFKYFWSPIVDRLKLPLLHPLGRRRSWMLLAQCGIASGLVAMALHDPAADPMHMALLAALTALAAATQDIAIDAYRIEAAQQHMQGSMAAAYQVGYQIALVTAGAGALVVAARLGWSASYLAMAALVGVGIVTTLLIAEPEARIDRATLFQEERVVAFLERNAHWPASVRNVVAWLIGAIVCPFVDFFARYGGRASLPVLLLMLTYRLNYTTMGVAANTFYNDLGYTLEQIALVSKIYGVAMTLTAGVVGGALVMRLGVLRTMIVGWVLLTCGNLFYAFLGTFKPDLWWLAAAISVDNLGNGIAGVAFIAWMSSLTNTAYTATQYALFGTLWSLPAKSVAALWGAIVDAIGYPLFFVYTAAVGVPALVLILHLMQRSPVAEPQAQTAATA